MQLTPEERLRIREEEEERAAVRAEISADKEKRIRTRSSLDQCAGCVLAVIFGGVGAAAAGPIGAVAGLLIVLLLAASSRPRG